MPDQLRELYLGSTPASTHFLKYVKPYNNIFTFTSMGVHVDKLYASRYNGIYTYRAQGQIYHYINSLYPSDGNPSYLQLYFYDTENEPDLGRVDKSGLELPIIDKLINILEPNPYSRILQKFEKP